MFGRVPIGGHIEVMGASMRVVGLSEGTRSWMAGFGEQRG